MRGTSAAAKRSASASMESPGRGHSAAGSRSQSFYLLSSPITLDGNDLRTGSVIAQTAPAVRRHRRDGLDQPADVRNDIGPGHHQLAQGRLRPVARSVRLQMDDHEPEPSLADALSALLA